MCDPPAAAPLDGVRILSLAEQYPGPFATMILADLGAEVVLVERPRGGDPTRRFPGHFAALNRNKRSVALDLKTDRGRAVFLDLAGTADAVLEGFRPGTMARLGLAPDDLRQRFPALVCASVSGFGQTGPLGRRGGHDLSVQGLAGFVPSSGERVGEPAPLPLADLASGMFAALGIVTALLRRERSGVASTVDVAMLDSLVAWQATSLVPVLNGLRAAPYPPDDPGYGVFEVGPGRELLTLSIAGEDHQWRALCAVLGLDDLAGVLEAERDRRRDEIVARLASAFRQVDPDAVEAALAERGVGVGRVNDLATVAADPQVVDRGSIVTVTGADGALRVVRQPVRFDGRAGAVHRGVPRLGEDTRAVLDELGYRPEAVAELLAAGVVADGAPSRVG